MVYSSVLVCELFSLFLYYKLKGTILFISKTFFRQFYTDHFIQYIYYYYLNYIILPISVYVLILFNP